MLVDRCNYMGNDVNLFNFKLAAVLWQLAVPSHWGPRELCFGLMIALPGLLYSVALAIQANIPTPTCRCLGR